MTTELISPFEPGCELWITADSANSSWSRKIDWYLNFQAMRAENHQSAEISPELRAIQDRWSVDTKDIKTISASALLVASQMNLPNSKTVFIPFNQDLPAWVKECRKVCAGLFKSDRPKVRIFLPDAVQPDVFLREWKKSPSGEPFVIEMIDASQLAKF